MLQKSLTRHLTKKRHSSPCEPGSMGTAGFYGVSWSTTHICIPGLPCNPGEGERGRALRCTLPCSMLCQRGALGIAAVEGSPGRASQHPGTAGSPHMVHIPPLISRVPVLLLSALGRNLGLFAPLPSPVLLKELLHQSQRKQRMGWRLIWMGWRLTGANVPLLENNILPPANKIAKSEQSALPRP